MVRRAGSISPQKEVRRSIRERTTVYRSLAENHLGNNSLINSLVDEAHCYQRRMNGGDDSNGLTRSGRHIKNYGESSDDFSEEQGTWNRRTRRSSRIDHEDENSPLAVNQPKRRKIIIEDDSEPGEQPNSEYRSKIRDRAKERINGKSPKSPSSKSDVQSPTTQREMRSRKRDIKKDSKMDETEEGEMEEEDREVNEGEEETEEKEETQQEEEESSSSSEEEEEEKQGPRQYQLRERRKIPTRQQSASTSNLRPSRAERYIARERDRHQPRQSRSERSELKRRMCRSDSSSTGSDDNDREMRRRRGGRRQNDDERFERRKEMSMIKARNRFIPLNLSEKDLNSSQAVVRERLRQAGASCSDVDPMAIDKTIGFDEVGGLGTHIQSLKEVVLFPLLYPDVFQNFNINPPKGVLFYGPPGTGKTLVARALANECSRGDKKVAFFMRKGADCLSKWVGESERQLRILFDQAYAMRPSIIFFDEIDGLAPVRSTRQDQIHASIVSTLLALMDGLDNRGEVIVIGATNRLDSIDPALRRPGRFDRELRFSLPDSAARLQILKIHTSKWGDSQPDEQLMNWIAQNTSGYCGADLKYLCTEAVMISLRNHYPHIYLNSERLKLNLSEVKVSKENLLAAMKRITPASRRDLSIPCRPLDDRTSILLSGGIDNLMKCIPDGYRCSRNVEVTGSCPLEKVVRALEEQPAVSAARLVLVGNPASPDSGQTSYVLPALLSKLDHLPVHCISIGKLFAEGRPEESFATIFQAALRSSSQGPCILLCPSIDEWFKIVPNSVTHMLKVAIDQITGFTPILFLASTECDYDECPEEVTRIFRTHTALQMPLIASGIRKQYFKFICAPAFDPPKIFDPSKYVEPEKAQPEDQPARKLSQKEAKELEKLYENQLREFRIFLRDQLGKLVRDRRFTHFTEPVDLEEAEDYHEIIKEPMCFTQMQEKVDMKEYTHPDQFLADIKLIVNNALEYNPVGDLHSKMIRHSATALKDIVEEYFEKEFDEEFVEKLEETARLLVEAKIIPQNEALLTLPDGFVRKTKWSVVTGFRGSTNSGGRSTPNGKRVAMFRGSTYKFPSNKKQQKSREIVKSIAESLSTSDRAPELEPKQEEESVSTPVFNRNRIHTEHSEGVLTTPVRSPVADVFVLDEHKMDGVISAAILRSNDWAIPELETLAAAMANIIEKYRNNWNRTALPAELMSLVDGWEYEALSSQKNASMS